MKCACAACSPSHWPDIFPIVSRFPRKVFEYLDSREFLRDYYAHRKEHEYGFSYRVFARRAGCKSSNFPHLVMQGKRNLSRDSAIRFAEACGLEGGEVEYFSDLVAFNQAKNQREKEHWYQSLTKHSRFRRVHRLTEAQATYFSHWYIPAIRELAAREDFVADPAWLSKVLVPAITEAQAKRALRTLHTLGLLATDADGRTKPAQGLLSSGGPLGHHLVKFHRAMLARASAAIDLVDREEREISSLTLCISEKRLAKLKEEIRAFRKHLLQTAEEDDRPERVVQIGFQLFPLSKSPSLRHEE